MKQLTIFNSPEFGNIRSYLDRLGEPWFCLNDVCRSLGLGNPSQVKTQLKGNGCLSNEVSTPIIAHGKPTGKFKAMKMTFISEGNLYRCVFNSRKPAAQAFQDWVCQEVLPSIRAHGVYATPDFLDRCLEDPDFAIEAIQRMKTERERKRLQ